MKMKLLHDNIKKTEITVYCSYSNKKISVSIMWIAQYTLRNVYFDTLVRSLTTAEHHLRQSKLDHEFLDVWLKHCAHHTKKAAQKSIKSSLLIQDLLQRKCVLHWEIILSVKPHAALSAWLLIICQNSQNPQISVTTIACYVLGGSLVNP